MSGRPPSTTLHTFVSPFSGSSCPVFRPGQLTGFRCPLFFFLYSNAVLRKRPGSVPVQQPLRGGRRRDMGQRGGLRETVSGEVHQCLGGQHLHSEPDDTGQDRRLCSGLCFPAHGQQIHPCPVQHGLCSHCQLVCSIGQCRVSTVSHPYSCHSKLIPMYGDHLYK